jgi:hypothetical protein
MVGSLAQPSMAINNENLSGTRVSGMAEIFFSMRIRPGDAIPGGASGI